MNWFERLLARWWHAEAKWWQFWLPGSGIGGGLLMTLAMLALAAWIAERLR